MASARTLRSASSWALPPATRGGNATIPRLGRSSSRGTLSSTKPHSLVYQPKGTLNLTLQLGSRTSGQTRTTRTSSHHLETKAARHLQHLHRRHRLQDYRHRAVQGVTTRTTHQTTIQKLLHPDQPLLLVAQVALPRPEHFDQIPLHHQTYSRYLNHPVVNPHTQTL